MSKNRYSRYYLYGELEFPYAERAYFDYIGTEFKSSPIQNKLLDIGYMLYHGYDVRAMIHHTYSEAHLSVNEDNVRYAICILLGELLKIKPIHLRLKYESLSTDNLIDVFFSHLLNYYHIDKYGDHYIKSLEDMTEEELKAQNPWLSVAKKYERNEFLFSEKNDLVCDDDKEIIEAFNSSATGSKDEFIYHLNVPAYPWYGNPLKANVIVLSLNPGYVERESAIAKVIQNLPEKYTEGYTEHLRRILTFDCPGFLPDNSGLKGMTYRDLANLHQSWYWEDRLTKAFGDVDHDLSFDVLNGKFAVIQYVGYSSKKYAPLKNRVLPSQLYTRKLIEFILRNNPNVVFIVARNVKMWQHFLGNLWDKDRFIESKDYLGQRFTEKILGKEAFDKVVKAFKS